jgi:hypothetical protein
VNYSSEICRNNAFHLPATLTKTKLHHETPDYLAYSSNILEFTSKTECIMGITEIISTTTIFFLVMDPRGNIPIFVSVMKDVDPARKLKFTFWIS